MEINKKQKVITRFAPSPTGVLHIGSARTALFNYLFAKQNGGKFILRIEDTDLERSREEYTKDILDSMSWLGLKFKSIYYQSRRTHVYRRYINKLIEENKAYVSKEEEGERSEVIRFRNPNREITFTDLIRGEIKFDTTELGDFVIAKSLEEPIYHLAVVIDDYDMGITHIIRGEDGISNTPRQILIQEAIGAPIPQYAHLPLILGEDKSKLSKRHGATSITEYSKKGYLKEAIINHLAFLGWNPGTEKEVYSLKELVKDFSIENISKGGAVFNIEKLNWFNREHLKRIKPENIQKEILKQFKIAGKEIDRRVLPKVSPMIMDRIYKWSDISEILKTGELEFMFSSPNLNEPEKIIWKDSDREKTISHLKKSIELFSTLSDNPNEEEAKEKVWDYASEQGRGDVLWPIRYALSGLDKSPDPFCLISALGKDESISRINLAIKKLNEISN